MIRILHSVTSRLLHRSVGAYSVLTTDLQRDWGDSKAVKKPPAAPKKKPQSLAEKAVAEDKAAFVDIDMLEGRSLRKQAAAPPSSAPKTSEKAITKRQAAAPKKAKGSQDTKDS